MCRQQWVSNPRDQISVQNSSKNELGRASIVSHHMLQWKPTLSYNCFMNELLLTTSSCAEDPDLPRKIRFGTRKRWEERVWESMIDPTHLSNDHQTCITQLDPVMSRCHIVDVVFLHLKKSIVFILQTIDISTHAVKPKQRPQWNLLLAGLSDESPVVRPCQAACLTPQLIQLQLKAMLLCRARTRRPWRSRGFPFLESWRFTWYLVFLGRKSSNQTKLEGQLTTLSKICSVA